MSEQNKTFLVVTCTFSNVVGFEASAEQLKALYTKLLDERFDAGVSEMEVKIISRDEWEKLPENNE